MVICTVIPVKVYICEKEGEKVVSRKGDTILVLVGLVQIVSIIREITVFAGMGPDWAILVKLI